jgi:hypothetical protein
MNTHIKIIVSVLAASLMTACEAPQPQATRTQQSTSKPLSYEQKYCLGMAGVTVGTMEMVQGGGRSWQQIQTELVNLVREAGWPLNQTDFDDAVEMGLTGVRGGDDPRAVAGFILRECMASAWYSR